MVILQVLTDGGGYYAETNLKNIIVEPWNAISSLSFWIPVVYIISLIKGRYKQYVFLTYSLPLLFLGGLGSTLFHAFRISSFLLWLDVLPTAILTISFIIYIWTKVLPHWSYTIGVLMLYFILQYFIFQYAGKGSLINLSYLLRGIVIFLPTLLLLKKVNFRYASWLIMAIFMFIVALFFRYLDKDVVGVMYMGSHWLWHLATSVGTLYLAKFLYHYTNLERLNSCNE
jgi:hypothetical protein